MTTEGLTFRTCLLLLLGPVLLRGDELELLPVDPGEPRAKVTIQTVPLRPTTQPGRRQPIDDTVLRDSGWQVQVEKTAQPGGPHWRVVYTRAPEFAYLDRPAEDYDPAEQVKKIPVIRVPEIVWGRWFSPRLSQAVGIHLLEKFTGDTAHVLFTQHPRRGAGGDRAAGCRIEATLLSPLTWWIDQVILIRKDRSEKLMRSREAHELGHALTGIQDLVAAIQGPQDWDIEGPSGTRSTLVWRWRDERVYRAWSEYRDGEQELPMLRTYVTIIPPSRWTKLSSSRPGRVDRQELLLFNRLITDADSRFWDLRAASNRAWHDKVGEVEVHGPPRFKPPKSISPYNR